MAKTAVVFPGQGSQKVGMLEDLWSEEIVQNTLTEASEVLGYDMAALISTGPDEQLNQTEFTQPALLTASIALWRLAKERGLKEPDMVAGHSLGEYSALVAAEVIEFKDAVSLVQKRGQYMQSAVPLGEGGMAAILGLDDQSVETVCRECSEEDSIVQAANFNATGQVVIAGKMDALNRAIEACKEAGAKRAMALAVSAPFHSQMMEPAAEQMKRELDAINFSSPNVAVIQNVDAGFEDNPENIKANLVKQMSMAVQWTATINKMAEQGVENVIECGPGAVLAGLNKRINKAITSFSINGQDSMLKTLETFS